MVWECTSLPKLGSLTYASRNGRNKMRCVRNSTHCALSTRHKRQLILYQIGDWPRGQDLKAVRDFSFVRYANSHRNKFWSWWRSEYFSLLFFCAYGNSKIGEKASRMKLQKRDENFSFCFLRFSLFLNRKKLHSSYYVTLSFACRCLTNFQYFHVSLQSA